MPNTLIREGYLDSDRVSALTDFEDRVFFRILLAADDAGRTDGRADKLRSALFPTRETVRSGDIEKAVTKLQGVGLLNRWAWDGKPVVQVMRWQRRSGAQYSKYPDADGGFKIRWVNIETRDGKHAFSLTSLDKGLATHAQPIDNPSEGVSEKPTYTETKTKTETDGFAPAPESGKTRIDAEAVYAAYPRKVGHKAAIRKIDAALTELRDRFGDGAGVWLLNRVRAFAASPAGRAGEYTPHCATWMNQGRYDDDEGQWQRGGADEPEENDNGFVRRVPTEDEIREVMGGGE